MSVWFTGVCGADAAATDALPYTPLRAAVTTTECVLRGEGLVALQQLGNFSVMVDGRIDNAAELHAELRLAPSATAAEVFLAAYLRWQQDFPAHVLGDYVFAIWHGPERTLLVGRDATGVLPLFLAYTAQRVHFASCMQRVLAVSGLRMVANQRHVATRLRLGFDGTSETMFEGVERMPKGELLIWRDGRAHRHRFWHPERMPMLQMRDPREYAEAAREVLYSAVARRLPATGLVAAHLSGGLDSSTVTDTAARLLQMQSRGLTAYTAVPVGEFNQSLFRGKFCDETTLARAVAQQHGNVDHVLISNQTRTVFEDLDTLSEVIGRPLFNPANSVWIQAILRDASSRGIGVLLDGAMSNFTFSYDGGAALPTLLRAGRVLAAAQLGRALHRHQASWHHIASVAMLPLLAPALRNRVLRTFGRQPQAVVGGMAANPAFLAAHGYRGRDDLREQADPRLRRLSFILGMQDDQAAMFARAAGLASASPTADRQVIEFCLAVPEEQFCAGGDRRALIRNMMQGLLPEQVLRERRRGMQAADAFSLMLRDRESFVQELKQMQQVDLVRQAMDLPRLQALVQQWPQRASSIAEHDGYTNVLPRAVSMGRFLRRMEQGELYAIGG